MAFLSPLLRARLRPSFWIWALGLALIVLPRLAFADVYVAAVQDETPMSMLFFGLLIGVVLSAAGYLFFIWIVIHDRGQVFLIIFLVCLAANISSSNALLMGKIGVYDPSGREFLSNLSMIVSWIFALYFTYYFLELDTNNPRFRLPFILIGILLMGVLLYSVRDRTLIYFALPPIGALTIGAVLLAGLSGVRRGTSGSLVHIIAFVCYLGGVLAEAGYVLGYLKTPADVHSATYLSFALSSLLFAIVVANQFAARQDEKEKALGLSNERFALATRGANEGLFDWNMQTGEVFFSDQFRRIVGYRLVNGVEGLRRWIRMIQPTYRARVRSTLRQFRHNGKASTVTVEYCIRLPNGDQRWLHSKAIAVRDRVTQRVTRLVGSTSDVTERKKSEFALVESENRLRSIIEAHPVPVLIVSPENGIIYYATPGCEALLGMKQEAIVQTTLPRFMPDKDIRARVLADIASGRPVDAVETAILRADGEKIAAAVSARGIAYQNEKAMVMGIYDLTEFKKAQAQIEQQQEALQQSEKMAALGGLLAGVAHELNNPLSVVVGQSTLLMEGSPEPKVASRAEKIFKAADRCARIVKSFLALARRKPPEHKEVDLNQIVRSSLELLGYQLRTGDIQLQQNLEPELSGVVGDSDQLTQVVTNLVLNATQAMDGWKAPHKLTVTTKKDPSGTVTLIVADTGPGIPADIRSRIFEPFFTTKGGKGGTGVGLALCLNVVTAHGGQIVLSDTPGGGATFTVEFPPMQKPPAESGEEIAEPAQATGKLRLLLVDDEVELAQTLADLLEPEGHTIDIAADGSIAMDKLRKAKFDAIISDLRMPVMDGPALYDALQSELPSYINRIIYVTGDTLSTHVQQFLSQHTLPVIEKPYRLKDIRRALGDLIKNATTKSSG